MVINLYGRLLPIQWNKGTDESFVVTPSRKIRVSETRYPYRTENCDLKLHRRYGSSRTDNASSDIIWYYIHLYKTGAVYFFCFCSTMPHFDHSRFTILACEKLVAKAWLLVFSFYLQRFFCSDWNWSRRE